MAAYVAFLRRPPTNGAVGAIATRGRVLVIASRRLVAAIHAATSRVRLRGDAATAKAASRVRPSSAPPLLMSKPDAVRVVPKAYSEGRSPAFPLVSAERCASAIAPRKAAPQLGANRKQEVLETGTNGALPYALRAPARAALPGRTPLKRT